MPRAHSDALHLARSVWRRAIQTAEAAELQRKQARALVDRLEKSDRDKQET